MFKYNNTYTIISDCCANIVCTPVAVDAVDIAVIYKYDDPLYINNIRVEVDEKTIKKANMLGCSAVNNKNILDTPLFKLFTASDLEAFDFRYLCNTLDINGLTIEDIEDLMEVDFYVNDIIDTDFDALGYWLIENGLHPFSKEVVDCPYFDHKQFAHDVMYSGDLRAVKIGSRRFVYFTH